MPPQDLLLIVLLFGWVIAVISVGVRDLIADIERDRDKKRRKDLEAREAAIQHFRR